MTSAGVQMLLALAAVAGAAGFVVWILHSRAAAKMRAREKAVEVARSRAQERARVAGEADDRRRIASEEREIALALLAAHRAELAKRRVEPLSSGAADTRVAPVAAPAAAAPAPRPLPPSQPQHRAQPNEAHEPAASKQGLPANVGPAPTVAAPDVFAIDASNAVEVAADGARQCEGAVSDTAARAETEPAERPLILLEAAVSPRPLDTKGDTAVVAGGAPFHAAPPDEPVAPDLYPPREAETQPTHETPVPITPGLGRRYWRLWTNTLPPGRTVAKYLVLPSPQANWYHPVPLARRSAPQRIAPQVPSNRRSSRRNCWQLALVQRSQRTHGRRTVRATASQRTATTSAWTQYCTVIHQGSWNQVLAVWKTSYRRSGRRLLLLTPSRIRAVD